MQNHATQTDIIQGNEKEIILNVNKCSPSVPLIKASVGREETTFLIDTGSSISILSEALFNKIKKKLTYKRLA